MRDDFEVMETNKNKSNNKTVSLRLLKIRRIILLSGFVLSAVVTVISIVYIAVSTVSQSDIFSGNWWSGIAMGGLVYCVLMLYLFSSIVILEIYNISLFSFLNRRERLKRWCEFVFGFVILKMFLSGIILLYVVLILLMSLSEISQLPLIPCVFTALFFLTSIILLAKHNETDCQIREKSDPNFRRVRGFS